MIDTIKKQWVLILIFVLGIFFRFWGIDWGLPFGYDADEPFQVGLSTTMIINSDPNPHWFGHPGTVAFYLLAAVYSVLYWFISLAGGFAEAVNFADATLKYPEFFLLSGRITLTLFGVASIGLVYRISEILFNKKTALLAAAFLALSPVHVFYGKLIRTDIIVTFFLLMAFYWSLHIIETKRVRYYILAAFFTGLAVATKYTGLLIASVPITAFLLTERVKEYKKLVWASVAGVIATFIGSPFLFLDWRTAKYNLIREARPTHVSGTGEGFFTDLVWYITNPLMDSITLIGCGAVVIGIILCIKSTEKKQRLLPIFPIIFLLFIALLSLRWERWFVPAIPFYAMLAAYGLYWISLLFARTKLLSLKIFMPLVFFVVFGTLIFKNSVQGVLLTSPDTRDIAQEWILTNIPDSARIAVEVYTPYLPKGKYRYFSTNEEQNRLIQIPDSAQNYGAYMSPPFARIGRVADPSQLDSLGIEYIILSNWYDRYKAESAEYPDIVKTYETIMSRSTLLYEIAGSPIVEDSRMLKPLRGPHIRVYKVNRD